MPIQRIAMISVHASPLAPMGGKKTGGMNVYIRQLAIELARCDIEVDIYTRRNCPDLPEIDHSLGEHVRVIHVNAGPPQHLNPNEIYEHVSQFAAGVIAFNTKQGGSKYDLVYSHYWLSGWVANKLKEVWDTPFVQMFHTLGHMKNRISSSTPMMLPDIRVATETKIVNWADRIIAATQAEYAQLLWLYRADRRKIEVVPPGVDIERFHPVPPQQAREQLGITDDCNLLLFVGRIEPLKAVDTILKAIDVIRSESTYVLSKLCFAVIGGNPNDPTDEEMQRLCNMCCDLELGDTVKFLGAKDHQLLPLYYSAAAAVVMPSDYESFGMVALEAMASGAPVIASEVGGLAFLVQDQSTGFLVPSRDPEALADGMMTILTQPEKRELLSKNAVQLAEQYAWPQIVDRLLPIFETVANSRSSAAVSRRKH